MMKISSQTQFKKLEQPFNIFPAYGAAPNSFGGKNTVVSHFIFLLNTKTKEFLV
jgi:hypothetical protein